MFKGTYVAVKCDEEPFWIAFCVENNRSDSSTFKIKWLERICVDKEGTYYAFGNDDKLLKENVICNVKVFKKGRFKYFLSLQEESKILKQLGEEVTFPKKKKQKVAKSVSNTLKIDNKNQAENQNRKNEQWVEHYLMNPHINETKCVFNDITIKINISQLVVEIFDQSQEEKINKEEIEIFKQSEKDEERMIIKMKKKKIEEISETNSGYFSENDEPFQSSGSEYRPDSESSHTDSSNFNNRCSSEQKTYDSDLPESTITPMKNMSLDVHTFHNKKSTKQSNRSSKAVTISKVTKTKSGNRAYDKRHACYFCDKIIGKVTRHLESVHQNEIEVAKLLAMDKNSKERKQEFMCLLRAGDYYHNARVLTIGTGELLVSRRPSTLTKNQNVESFGPCPNCLGFFALHTMWKHVKQNCPNKNDNISNKNIRIESYALMSSWSQTDKSNEFVKNILAVFKLDNISNICKSDDLILKLGALMFEKYSTQQHEFIRQTMRQLGRLVLQLKEKTDITKLSDALMPENFEKLIDAVKQMSLLSTEKGKACGIPSLALKLGYSLRKCACIARSNALRTGNLTVDKKMKAFLKIMSIDWSYRVSSTALQEINTRKMNISQNLPLTEDIIKLSKYLDVNIESTTNLLEANIEMEENWFKLASIVLARIIIFNKRRSGEVSRMTLAQYSCRPDWKNQATVDVKECLTPLEIHLANRLTVVEVPGKSRKNFKVPILLTPNIKHAIDILIQTRSFTKVDNNNIYVFAMGNGSPNSIRGHDVLRKYSTIAGLTKPECITSTKLRKYVATVVQILDLKENETDWLARHLGHDIKIHRDFYRLHESAIELTKVSRLLIAVDEGKTSAFKGKSLDEINFDTEISDLECEVDLQSDNEIDAPQLTENFPNTSKSTGKHNFSITKLGKGLRKKQTIAKKWSQEEITAVLDYFKKEIKIRQFPGKLKCKELLNTSNIFGNRPWTDIKYYIYRYIKKLP